MQTMQEATRASLEREGLDSGNVTDWKGRPKRHPKPRPQTYWEEFVETDAWYLNKLTEDVPPGEMFAACWDESLDDDDAGASDTSESDGEEEDLDYAPPAHSEPEEEISESMSQTSDATEDSLDSGMCTPCTGTETQVYRTP